MASEHCFWSVCLVPLYSTAPRIYAFPQFIAGLALMALSWTLADERYRFRVASAALPLRRMTFGVVAVIGTLTLLTDLWLAQHWLVVRGPLPFPVWEALLAGSFLLAVAIWGWVAFVRPPIFGRANARHYATAVYRAILQGSPTELPVVAEALMQSAHSLIRHASDRRTARVSANQGAAAEPAPTVENFADDVLLLIGDPRFCRTVVQSSPGTALRLFQEMHETRKYGVPIQTFAGNIVSIAIRNKDSFMYTEAEGYYSGLLGYHKPLTEAIFSNYELVDTVRTMFEPDWRERRKWDADEWEAFYRAVLITIRGYVANHFHSHSAVLYSAINHSEEAVFDLHSIDGHTGAWEHDVLNRLRVVVHFFEEVLDALDKSPPSIQFKLRNRKRHEQRTLLDDLAEAISEVIWLASGVRSPRDLCWSVQHNSVWSDIFDEHQHTGAASRAVKFKVRRLLFDEIAEMTKFPNFKGARILGLCLNVMGVRLPERNRHRDSRALHKAVLRWTKKNYAWLHAYNPKVAAACLVEDARYDAEHRRIIKTWPAEGLRRTPHEVVFEVDPPNREVPTADLE